MRRSRMRPLDPYVSFYLPESRCQQVLPVDRGFDPFDSVCEPTLEASQPVSFSIIEGNPDRWICKQ
jgi:hypothetical protein